MSVPRSQSLPIIRSLPGSPESRRDRSSSFSKYIPTGAFAVPSKRQSAADLLLRSTEGRERSLRALQYGLRLLIWLADRRQSVARRSALSRLLGIVTFLSALRKILRIASGRSLSGVRQLTAKTGSELDLALVEESASLADDLFDDLYMLSGLLPSTDATDQLRRRVVGISDVALLVSSLARFALLRIQRAHLWMVGRKVYEIYKTDWEVAGEEASLRRKERRAEMRALKARLSWLQGEKAQAACDAVFSAYDVFSFSRFGTSVRALSGSLSAFLGLYQLVTEPDDPLA